MRDVTRARIAAWLTILALVTFLFLTGGCNTMKGAAAGLGRDMEVVGGYLATLDGGKESNEP
jgi:predicted small secreted protein